MSAVGKTLRINQHFTVAYSRWSNGTCETHDRGSDPHDWVDFVPLVQLAPNAAFRERYGPIPLLVVYIPAPQPISMLLSWAYGGTWKVDALLGPVIMGSKVQHVVAAQEVFTSKWPTTCENFVTDNNVWLIEATYRSSRNAPTDQSPQTLRTMFPSSWCSLVKEQHNLTEVSSTRQNRRVLEAQTTLKVSKAVGGELFWDSTSIRRKARWLSRAFFANNWSSVECPEISPFRCCDLTAVLPPGDVDTRHIVALDHIILVALDPSLDHSI